MRTTVDLDPQILRRLRDEAHRRGIPFKQVLASAIRRGLNEPETPRVRYKCPVYSLGKPSPHLDLNKALRVAGELGDAEISRKIDTTKPRR